MAAQSCLVWIIVGGESDPGAPRATGDQHADGENKGRCATNRQCEGFRRVLTGAFRFG